MTNQHASDCAVHSEPAYPAGPCDCHLSIESRLDEMIKHAYQGSTDAAFDIFQELVERYKAMQPAPVQEPAGWRPATYHRQNLTFNPGLPDEQTVKFWNLQGVEIEYCYTTQPAAQRQWVGLTDEEIIDVIHPLVVSELSDERTDYEIAKAIEAKLREKNNG